MKVWVVMGNDYPESVHASEEAAELHIAKLKAIAEEEATRLHADERHQRQHASRIFWRAYEFEVQS